MSYTVLSKRKLLQLVEQGIVDGLIRFSLGIEEIEDLKEDLVQALEIVKSKASVSSNT